MRQFKEFFKLESRILFRDKHVMLYTLFFPILIMVIMGAVIGAQNENSSLKVCIIREDMASKEFIPFINALRLKKNLVVQEVSEEKAALKELQRGDIQGVVIWKDKRKVLFYYNPTDISNTQQVRGSLEGAIREANYTIINKPRFVNVRQEKLQFSKKESRYIDFLFPGIIAMSIMMSGVYTISGHLVRLKDQGIMKQFFTKPFNKMVFISANIFMRLILANIQALVILLIAQGLFHTIPFVPNLAFFGYITLCSASMMCFGILIASFSKDAKSANLISGILVNTMLFLSGIYFPIEFMPKGLQMVSKVLPLTYAAGGLRYIIGSVGMSSQPIGLGVLVMLIYGMVGIGTGLRYFKWT